MCRYCKKLKEIKDLEQKEYVRIINSWRRQDYKARKLIDDMVSFLNSDSDDEVLMVIKAMDLVDRCQRFLKNDCIGK